ncbi:hypothetical protein RI662_25490 [Brevibacillus agri]|uniref:hypothetical protein n=1 Tax=Brevibacillus agri TaxID=51101 RepID=UPI00287072A7|nr:hypothetical protein [Brevibacillus agri]MDR9507588.1 hypothetical protein [Brevibacillus agri]
MKPSSILSNLIASNISDLSSKTMEELLKPLTPEQRLKADVLRRLHGDDQVADVLLEHRSIDYLFKRTAEAIYQESQY